MIGMTDDDLFGAGPVSPDMSEATPAVAAPVAPAPQSVSMAALYAPVTADEVTAAANAAGIDPDFYSRILRQEHGVRQSPAGAIGPAQIMPPTAVKLRIDPTNRQQNLEGGARYLKQLYDQFHGDESLAAAGYNAGPEAVVKYGGVPPYPETQAYVAGVTGSGQTAPGDLSPKEQSDWDALQGAVKGAVSKAANTSVVPQAATTPAENPARGVYDPAADVVRGPGGAVIGIGSDTFKAPDGSLGINVPGTDYSPKAVQAWLAAHPNDPSLTPAVPANQPGQTTGDRAYLGVNQGLANIGATGARAQMWADKMIPGAQAVDQTLSPLLNMPTGAQAVSADMVQRLRNDQAYANSPAYGWGKLGGEAALTVPAMVASEGLTSPLFGAIPGLAEGGAAVRSLPFGNLLMRGGSGALQGAEAAGIASGGSDRPLPEQLMSGAKFGGAFGAVAPELASRASSLFGGNISQAVSDLANTAVNKYKIPLRIDQIKGAAGNRAAAVSDSNDIGTFGTGAAANQGAQLSAFTRAIAGTFGSDSSALTPEVMQAAKTRIGGVFNDVAGRTNIVDADGVMDRLHALSADAGQTVTDQELAPITRQIENIGSKIDQTGQIPGDAYQALTRKGAPLDRATESSNPNIRYYAQQVRGVLDDGLTDSALPEDVAALQQARSQYKNLMTIKNLAAKAGVEGTVSPLLLRGAVNTSFKNSAFTGAGDLGELSQIGQTFMKEPPQSGTQPRLMDVLKKAAPWAGAADFGLATQNPDLALKAAAAAGLGTAAKVGADVTRGALNRSAIMRSLLLSGAGFPTSGPIGNALSIAGSIARPAIVPASVLWANQLTQPQPQP